GGTYNASGNTNYGVHLSNATLNAGVDGGSGLNTITVTGIGGTGLGNTHAGVYVETTAFAVNLAGTNPANSLTFLNCLGGTGAGGSNYGVGFGIGLTQVSG